MQMSVFRGGCSPNAAEQLAGANPRILQALVNNALLMQTRDGRYDIHELLRQYAEEQLQISDLESAAHTAHANYFLTEVERAEPELTGENQIFWYDYLDAEYDNIRAAIQWFIMSQDVESEYRMIGALLWFWFYRKSSSEGYHWTERAMARDGDHISPFIHGKALNSAGAMAFTSNNHKLAADYHGRALALFRELDDKPQIAFTLLCVSSQLMGLGDFNAAIELCEEGLSLATALGVRGPGIQLSNTLGGCLGGVGNMGAC
jgi:hypothetical protein